MPSLPPRVPRTRTHTPDDVYVRRLGRVDGCPSCVTGYWTPSSVHDAPEAGGFLANYICEDCGWAWTTAWRDEPCGGDPA